MPFYLKIVAAEPSWHGKPENQVSGFIVELNIFLEMICK